MRRTRLVLTVTALAAASALLLSACTGGEEPAPTATGAPDPDATVAIRLVLEPGNLDILHTAGAALDQILIDNIYQGLVRRLPDQTIEPSLASEYTVSDDGLTYTFTLREGITFHDGKKLTPADVVWSLRTQKKEGTDAARLSRVKKIQAKGQTITLTLSEPDSSLLWNLSGRAGLVFKRNDTIDYKTAANGTGPFTLLAWKQGDSITFERNDEYWSDKAKAKQIAFHYVPDNQAALNGALAGDFDVLTGFDATLKDQVEANGDFQLVLGSATDKYVLAMNSTREPLSDKNVRKAIRQAINHDAQIELAGAGRPLYGPIPEPDPGYEDLSSLVPYDPEAAKQLLADAGAEGTALTLTVPSFYPTAVSTALVSDLDAVGITLTVDTVDFNTWIDQVYTNKDYDLSLVDHAEARDFENWANPDYYFTYDSPEVQSLYQQSLSAVDEAAAADLLKQAARIVSEDMAADWIFNWQSVQAVATGITGLPADNVNARLFLVDVAKSTE
ncbi:MAG: ABC transporter substrate-binding protein [Microbacterium sp.]|uniref:ABC transporter substrate-binding protein n=1 Tax=Microbacterium sp. TaxID=51671 RepID=UPI0039E3A9EE